MKLLLIDDQERLVFEGNVDIKSMHLKSNEPEIERDIGFLTVPEPQPLNYSLELKADLVDKNRGAFRVYPDRVKDADVTIDACYTRGKTECIHEQEERHRAFCTDWVCYC